MDHEMQSERAMCDDEVGGVDCEEVRTKRGRWGTKQGGARKDCGAVERLRFL